VLDKSKGLVLGDELIAQPLNFNAWVKTAAVTSFTANSFTTNAGGGVTLQLFAGLSNKAYCITMKGTSTTVGTLRNGGTGSVGTTIPVGAFDIVMNTPTLASFGTALYIALGSAGTVTVDSISVKELHGNHAYQSTSAARPILRDTPRRIDFDAVDDKLTTTFPAQLAGCTVIRSVPNVGTQILTGQTIPVTYVDNKDYCGLIVINRALTPSETSAITAEFNKRAGV